LRSLEDSMIFSEIWILKAFPTSFQKDRALCEMNKFYLTSFYIDPQISKGFVKDIENRG